jgi:hypothetical protein
MALTRMQARGCKKGLMTKIVIIIDDETFAEVRRRAVKAGTSVAEQMRILIEWGLMSEKE